MKVRFENIKGLLEQEEMKKVIGGGDIYNGHNTSGSSPAVPASGTALAGALNTSLGITVSYGTAGNYSTSSNYGAGGNGTYASGNPANTFNNMGSSNNGATTSTSQGYGQP